MIIIKLIQVFVTKPEQISVLANHLPSLAYTVAVTPQMPMNREVQSCGDGVLAKCVATRCMSNIKQGLLRS